MNEFTPDQLISFGQYLLSKERTNRILSIESELSSEERLKEVYHADVENWKDGNITS